MQVTNSFETIVPAPAVHTEVIQPHGVNYVDQRREIPRQGFVKSNVKVPGPAQHNIPSNQLSNDKEMMNPPYITKKVNLEDRNALSQDWGVEMKNIDLNRGNLGDRKSSAKHDILDVVIQNNQSNRNFKQKVICERNAVDGEVSRVERPQPRRKTRVYAVSLRVQLQNAKAKRVQLAR